MSAGEYDPVADLAALATVCYRNVIQNRYQAAVTPLRNLVHGLGLTPEQAASPAAWQKALRGRPEHDVHIVPSTLAIEDALAALGNAKPGTVAREAATGREWVRVSDQDTWLERDGTKGAPVVLTCQQ